MNTFILIWVLVGAFHDGYDANSETFGIKSPLLFPTQSACLEFKEDMRPDYPNVGTVCTRLKVPLRQDT